MKNKGTISTVTIFGIVLVVYLLTFLIVPFKKVVASWISFGFTIFAIGVGLSVFMFAFKKNSTLISKLYGFPILKIGLLYTIIQFALGVLFCILGAFIDIPAWIVVLPSVILLALASIGLIIADNSRDLIESMDNDTAKKTQAFDSIKINVASIMNLCNDNETKRLLEKLYEKFKYSDPISCPKSEESEEIIISLIADLRQLLASNDKEKIIDKIKEIEIKLAERNLNCKNYKRTV